MAYDIPASKVRVAPPDRGVLIFHAWRNKIPEGVQVLHACGTTAATPAPLAAPDSDGGVVHNARFAFDTFLDVCIIDNVVVSEGADGYCRIYVNWSANPSRAKNVWWEGETYRNFLRTFFNETYKNVKLKHENGKTSLRFSDRRAKGAVAAKIVFVCA